MSDNVLSQEEIDALLQGDLGLDDMEEDDSADVSSADDSQAMGPFKAEHQRVLTELTDAAVVNEIGIFKSYLNEQDVVLTNGKLALQEGKDIVDSISSSEHLFVSFDLDDGKGGFIISTITASMISQVMTTGEYDGVPLTKFTELELSALQDCFNGLVGKMLPAMKVVLGKDFSSKPPAVVVLTGKDVPPEAAVLKENNVCEFLYDLSIGEEPPAKLRFVLSEELAKNFVKLKIPTAEFAGSSQQEEQVDLEALGQSFDESVKKESKPAEAAPQQQAAQAAMPQQAQVAAMMPGAPGMAAGAQMDPNSMQQMLAQQQAMIQQLMAQQGGGGGAQATGGGADPGVQTGYSPWQFAPVTPYSLGATQMTNMELLKDVTLQVTVELGRARLPIGQILELVNGSIVELNKQAGEAVELYVQGKLIARGEVVIIDENFGIRITSIVSPQERLNSLRGK
jgi:flagellar motor switch protein FliN/FliY